MHTENGLLVDLKQIGNIVADADVLAVAFRLFPERLLIDTRSDGDDPVGPCALPMVAIVDPMPSVHERFFWLGQHRPSLGMPQNFKFFFWPHSIGYLVDSGVWDLVRERVAGFDGSDATLDAAIAELGKRERAAHLDAIRGEQHHTLWSATPD